MDMVAIQLADSWLRSIIIKKILVPKVLVLLFSNPEDQRIICDETRVSEYNIYIYDDQCCVM